MADDSFRDALDNPKAISPICPDDAGHKLGNGGRRPRPPFPPNSPVTPLGIHSDITGSQKCYYLNHLGELVGLEANNGHGKNGMVALFGERSAWLNLNFPQWSKPIYEGRGASRECVRPAEIIGFDQADASRALIEECGRRGIFDLARKIRGAGAHRQTGGGIVLHCGEMLLVSRHYATTGELRDMRWIPPGVHEGFVYTAAAALPRPENEPAHSRCAEILFATLTTWNWKRPLLDPRFVLGAIGGSLLGGWLP